MLLLNNKLKRDGKKVNYREDINKNSKREIEWSKDKEKKNETKSKT